MNKTILKSQFIQMTIFSHCLDGFGFIYPDCEKPIHSGAHSIEVLSKLVFPRVPVSVTLPTYFILFTIWVNALLNWTETKN